MYFIQLSNSPWEFLTFRGMQAAASIFLRASILHRSVNLSPGLQPLNTNSVSQEATASMWSPMAGLALPENAAFVSNEATSPSPATRPSPSASLKAKRGPFSLPTKTVPSELMLGALQPLGRHEGRIPLAFRSSSPSQSPAWQSVVCVGPLKVQRSPPVLASYACTSQVAPGTACWQIGMMRDKPLQPMTLPMAGALFGGLGVVTLHFNVPFRS